MICYRQSGITSAVRARPYKSQNTLFLISCMEPTRSLGTSVCSPIFVGGFDELFKLLALVGNIFLLQWQAVIAKSQIVIQCLEPRVLDELVGIISARKF